MQKPSTSNNSLSDKPLEALFFRDFKNSYIPQILEEVYIKKVYQPYLAGRSRDMVIADWGGNIGLTSYYFKDYASQVFCVEPSKQHQEVIEKLLEFNKIDNIKLCKYGISNKNGTEKFYHPENVTMFSMENVTNATDYEEVEMVSPDTFFEREGIDHIDLLKLDVEGSEGKVIASEGFIKVAPKIKVICGEWHNWAGLSKDLFANAMRDLGYEFKWLHNTDAACFTAVRI